MACPEKRIIGGSKTQSKIGNWHKKRQQRDRTTGHVRRCGASSIMAWRVGGKHQETAGFNEVAETALSTEWALTRCARCSTWNNPHPTTALNVPATGGATASAGLAGVPSGDFQCPLPAVVRRRSRRAE